MISLRSALLLFFVLSLIVFEERVSTPSCQVVQDRRHDLGGEVARKDETSADFKVMMVANLLLMGSEAGYMNMYFRDSYLSKFFRKSFDRLKPDMLVVLGDVSAKGSELTNSKWLSVLQQFQRMLGPFLGLPLHIVLGDRDIGECGKLNAKSVNRIASSLPGMDSAGCGAFEVSNISFVSLNAIALLCGNDDLRFSIEKVIERERLDLQGRAKGTVGVSDQPTKWEEDQGNFRWRQNAVESGSGPVLLLHFPLHRTDNHCGSQSLDKEPENNPQESSRTFVNRCEKHSSQTRSLRVRNSNPIWFSLLNPLFRSHRRIRRRKSKEREVSIRLTWFAPSGFLLRFLPILLTSSPEVSPGNRSPERHLHRLRFWFPGLSETQKRVSLVLPTPDETERKKERKKRGEERPIWFPIPEETEEKISVCFSETQKERKKPSSPTSARVRNLKRDSGSLPLSRRFSYAEQTRIRPEFRPDSDSGPTPSYPLDMLRLVVFFDTTGY